MVQTFKAVVDLWPSPEAMAGDLGVKVEAVRKWRYRDSIPAEFWLAIVAAAEQRDKAITVHDLAGLAARKQATGSEAA